jgi:hypothetical protein
MTNVKVKDILIPIAALAGGFASGYLVRAKTHKDPKIDTAGDLIIDSDSSNDALHLALENDVGSLVKKDYVIMKVIVVPHKKHVS